MGDCSPRKYLSRLPLATCLRLPATAALLLAGANAVAQPAAAEFAEPASGPKLVTEVSRTGGEYLFGMGVGFGPHRLLAHGTVLGFDPLGFNVGVGYGNDGLRAAALFRQHSLGRLPYLDVRDRTGGLLLIEYAPPDRGLRPTLANELYVGQVDLRHSGTELALYEKTSFTLDVLADSHGHVALVAHLSTLQLLYLPAGAFGVGVAAPMQFLDRTLIAEPRVLHSGLTHTGGAFARDLIGYRFSNFSVGRQFGVLGGGVRSDTGGTTALVLNLEGRLHFLRATDIPVLNGIFVAAFGDGGLFLDAAASPLAAGDFTVGGALGLDWRSISVAFEAGYNHAGAGFVWGVEIKSFR
jgi:hypothetical protein